MKITLLGIGKTDSKELESLIKLYTKRLNFYVSFETAFLSDIKNAKNLSEAEQKKKEGELLLSKISTADFVMLLDDKGKQFSSIEFSQLLQKRMNSGIKNLILVIGGPYGFSDAVYKRANSKLSLSKMTFSHQMIRLFITEQLYRGFTILRNEPYHHE